MTEPHPPVAGLPDDMTITPRARAYLEAQEPARREALSFAMQAIRDGRIVLIEQSPNGPTAHACTPLIELDAAAVEKLVEDGWLKGSGDSLFGGISQTFHPAQPCAMTGRDAA